MTDKEIIKALECCGENHIAGSTDACEHCFLQNSAMCVTELIYKSLDLINRQQETIETLRGCIERHHIIRKDGKSPLSLLTAEIRAEAIKECLNWVLSLFPEDKNFTTISRFTVNQKIKEMVGEDK